MSRFLNPVLERHHYHRVSPLVQYSLLLLFIALGDAIMSYVAPVYVESVVKNTFLMGVIIAASSVVGFACDLLFARYFPGKPYVFFLWLSLLVAFMFPASYATLPPLVMTFLIGMVTWGVYYELLQFANFNFIAAYVPREEYSQAWGTLNSFRSIAYMVGPLVAGQMLVLGFRTVFFLPMILYSFAAFGLLLLIVFTRRRQTAPVTEPKTSLLSQLSVWKALFSRVWLVYLFLFVLAGIDSAFWTIGTLVSEELRAQSVLGSLFLPAYIFPALFAWLFVAWLPATGKKKIAFISGGVGGLFLALVGVFSSAYILIPVVFTASVFIAVSFPEISAVFEDYVVRLGHSGASMVGLQASAVSAAYVLGPVISGALGQLFGNRQVFTVIGLVLAGYSFLAYFIVPRKIRMPESEISALTYQ